MTDADVAHRTRTCNVGEVAMDKEALSPASSTSSSSETRPRLEMDTKDDDTKRPAKSGTGHRGGGDLQGATTAPMSSSKVDRGKMCPFLLRVFAQYGAHHRPEDFMPRNLPVKQEIDIYTWKDATMREIGNLIKSSSETAASVPFVRMSFRLIFRNKTSGKFTVKDLGVVVPGRSPSRDEEKTLSDVRFEIGDYVDVAFFSGTERRPEMPGLGPGASAGGPLRDGGSTGRDPFPDRGAGAPGRFPPRGGDAWDRDARGRGGGARDEGWGGGQRGLARDDGWGGNQRGAWRDSGDRSGGSWRDRPSAAGAPSGSARNGGGGGAPSSMEGWGASRDRRDRDDFSRGFGGGNGGGGGGPDRRGSFTRETRRFEPYRDNVVASACRFKTHV